VSTDFGNWVMCEFGGSAKAEDHQKQKPCLSLHLAAFEIYLEFISFEHAVVQLLLAPIGCGLHESQH
jgi:hypothetical protein